jgi:serine/threonine-protein kinase
MVWVDRTGRESPTPASAEILGIENPRLSPDGHRVAAISDGDVWVYDLQGRPPIKLTFDGAHYSPLWSVDGRHIFYEASAGVSSVSADASGSPEPASGNGHLHPFAMSKDGDRLIVLRVPDAIVSQTNDIVQLSPGPKAELLPVVATPISEGGGGFSLSPDGRWLAYTSQATGKDEVWVQPYPGPGAAVRVSPNGGTEPIWAKNGRELYYIERRQMMVVAVQPGATFSFSPAQVLFNDVRTRSPQPPSYDVAADGRFLMIKGADEQTAAAPIVLTLNWIEELKRRVP